METDRKSSSCSQRAVVSQGPQINGAPSPSSLLLRLPPHLTQLLDEVAGHHGGMVPSSIMSQTGG